MKKYCRTCGILDKQQNVCPLLRSQVDPDKDYCTKHTTELNQCELCGHPTLTPFYTRDGDNWHIFCQECIHKLNSCSFCKKVTECLFETDPSPIPKMIQRRIQQGPMVTVATVKNPERIRQTCMNGCPCYDSEFDCMRQFNYCERMEYVYDDNSERDDSGAAEDSGDGPEVHSEIHE